MAAHYFFDEEGAESVVKVRVVQAAQQMISKYFQLDLKDIRGHGENRINPYTDAQLLFSLALALSPVTAATCHFTLAESERDRLLDHLKVLGTSVARQRMKESMFITKPARTTF